MNNALTPKHNAEGWGAARHEITCDLDEDCTCKEKE